MNEKKVQNSFHLAPRDLYLFQKLLLRIDAKMDDFDHIGYMVYFYHLQLQTTLGGLL